MANIPQNELIELRFVGGGVAPNTVKASDLADLLKTTETLVESTVLYEHRDLTRDDIILALSDVQNRSLGLRFSSSPPHIVVQEFERLATAIQQQSFDLLPTPAREALRKIVAFSRKNQCIVEFRTVNRDAVLATFDSTLAIPAAPQIPIQTTIYGRVLNAGGKNPNIHLETLHGQRIVCDGTQSQVKQLAERLYSFVGIIGTARCDAVTLQINEFEITDILPYEDSSIVEAMDALRQTVAPHFDDVDVQEYVRSIREEGEED